MDRAASLPHDPPPPGGDAFSAQIAGELETDIVFGRLRPGQKLPEEELAERFSATRHQVREALLRLVRIGIVIKERNKGVTVRRFSIEEVGEIYEVREILQRHAALRIPLPAPKASIAVLEAIHVEYEGAVARGDFHAIQKSNDRFHTELFRLCGNEVLAQLVKQYMDLSYAIRANAFSDPEHLVSARREHLVMISLLSTRDSWSLSQLCVDHIQHSKQQYLAMLQREARDGPQRGERTNGEG
jgi:DNA-binding GntR family transcriptional regulator